MIKAIIFDCFGVLVGIDYIQQFSHEFMTTTEEREKMESLHREVDLGLISRNQFISKIAGLAGLNSSEVKRNFERQSQVNLPLLKYIHDELKPKFKIGILSNVSSDGIAHNFTAAQFKLFDKVVLSAEVGMMKPDPKIFELTCQRLKVKPAEAVMVDDLELNCLGAEKVGLKTILFKDNQDLIAQLSKDYLM